MFKVDPITKKITLTRGDTFQCEVGARYKISGEPYEFQSGDGLRFALKRARMTAGGAEFVDRKPLILKPISTDDLILELDPKDTKPYPFGHYKYDIQLTYNGSVVDTIIDNADFELTPEVD